VLLAGLVIAVCAWALVEYERTRSEAQRTAATAGRIASELDRSLRVIEQSLRMTAAGLLGRPRLDETAWADFADRLQLPGLTLGGVSGLGFAPIAATSRASAHRSNHGGSGPPRPRYPLQYLRQWDDSAPLPDRGTDLNADSARVPELWRARRNLGPVYSTASLTGSASPESATAAWVLLAVTDDADTSAAVRGLLVASLRLEAVLGGALDGAADVVAELEVSGRDATPLRVLTGPWPKHADALGVTHELTRPGHPWRLRVARRDAVPMFGGSGWLLAAGCGASAALFVLALGTRDARRRAQRLEARAERSESRFQELAESAPFLVWMTDTALDARYLNPLWEQLTGWSRSDGMGSAWRELVHPDDRATVQQAFSETTAASAFRCRMRQRDGRYRWLLVSHRPLLGDDGTVTGFMGVGVDIDGVQRAEEVRAEEARTVREILDSVPAPICAKTEDLRYSMVNDAMCRLLGRSREEVLGRDDFALYEREQADEIRARDLEALAAGEFTFEAQYRFPGGAVIDATGAKTAVHLADGSSLVLTSLSDVTALRSQERQLVAVGARLKLTGEILRASLDACSREEVLGLALGGLVRLLGDVRITYWALDDPDIACVALSLGTSALPALDGVAPESRALARYRGLVPDQPCVVVQGTADADAPAGFLEAAGRAVIGMPVRVRGALVGVLEVEAPPRHWTSIDVGSVVDVGNALAAYCEFAAARVERDAAYRDLDAQRAFLDAIVDSIPHPVFVKDRAHRLVTVNQAVAAAWQMSKSEIVGLRDEDLLSREAALEAYAEDDRVFGTGVALTRETRFRSRAGPGEPALLLKQPVGGASGPEFLVGVMIPIGELKAAQQHAEESERLLSAVVNAIPTPVVAKDASLRWVLVNDAYLAAIGRTRESALGLTDADLLPADEARRHAMQDRQVLEDGQPQVGEESFHRADGIRAWRIETKQAVRMVDGRRLVVTTGIDITDRRRVETEALDAKHRLEVINELAAATIAGTAFLDIASLAVVGLERLAPGCAAVYVVIDETGQPSALRHAGFPDGAEPGVDAFRIGAAPAMAELLAGGRPMFVADLEGDPRVAALAAPRRSAGMAASIEVPVLRRGRLRGLAVVSAPSARVWTDQESGILGAVADALSLALEFGEARAERVMAERRLREAKDFVEGLIDAVPQAIFVKDVTGRWVMANEAFLRLSGRSRADVIDRTNRDLYPQTWECLDREDAAAFASPRPLQSELSVQDASGRTTWWLMSRSAVQLSAGTRYLVCTAADISELKSASMEVERGRQFLDAVLNAVPVPIFVKSEDHRWVVVNAAGERLYGRPRSELLGRTDHDLHDQAFSDAAWREDDHVLSGNGPIMAELRMPLLDGAPRWIMKTKVATTLADGMRFVIVASLDITGRKQAEEEVVASRARLEVLNGIAGRMVRGTPLVETVAFAVRSLSEALDGAMVSYWRRVGDRLVQECASGEGDTGVAVGLRESGRYLPRLETGEPVVVTDTDTTTDLGQIPAESAAIGMRAFVDVPVSAGVAGGLQAVLTLSSPTPRDWTVHERRTVQEAAESLSLAHINDHAERARTRVEAELRENEAVLQAMVWASDLGLWTWEAADDRYRISDRAKAQLGYAPDQVDDNGGWRSLLLDEDRPRFESALRAGLRSGSNRFEIEYRLRHREGSYRDILVRAQIQRDARGRVVRFVGGNIDVTEFRRTQEALRRHRDDLERVVAERTAELVTAKNAAVAANEAKSEFLANMSHELRTPMHSILSFSRLGINRMADGSAQLPKVRQYLDRIHQSGERLLTLLNDLLDLSKLEAGKMRYDFTRTDLAGVARTVTSEMSAYARERGVRIELSSAGPVWAWCDPARVGQVVRNLLSNAVKFTPAGKVVRVVLDLESAAVARIAVLDEGVGVPEDELESVFDKFVQSSKTNSGAGGTGLGLAICREIAQSHGGRIWAHNNAAGGACFTMTLPTDLAARAPRGVAA